MAGNEFASLMIWSILVLDLQPLLKNVPPSLVLVLIFVKETKLESSRPESEDA